MISTGSNPNVPIIHEDNHLLVVNKPAGLLSQADRTGDSDLLSICKTYLTEKTDKKGGVFLGLVHRLDRPAGGVMVFAKTTNAANRLAEQVRKREMRKIYLSVVHGNTPPNGVLVHHLLKDKERNFVEVVPSTMARGKKAELSYLKLQYNKIHNLTLVKINLITGRPHQIRVQFSEQGNPLYGDYKYGDPGEEKREMALHAAELVLAHPVSNEKMKFSAKAPGIHPWNIFD